MVPSTSNFSKLANAGKRKKSRNKEAKHLGEMPAIDTLSPVVKEPKKKKKK